MYGRHAGPSRVYRYGCLDPVQGVERIDEQLRRAHRYRNSLVEIERRRRERIREAITKAVRQRAPDLEANVEAAAARVAEIEVACAQARIRGRTRRVPADLQQALREARGRLRDARVALRQLREQVRHDEGLRQRLDAIDQEARAAIRHARAEAGLYWGTYLAVEQGMDRARRARGEPRFRHWDGGGKLAVQLQGGLPAAELFAPNTQCWIDPEPQPVAGRGGKPRPRLYFRVGSNPDGSPVWAVLPVVVHRPLPPNGRLKWVYLVRERVGTHYRWHAQCVVEIPQAPVVEAGPGVVAIDVGWRMIDGRLRVAYWYDGQEGGEVCLDARWVEGMARVERMRAHRDQLFVDARMALLEARDPSWPDWLLDETATAAQWRSPARLAALVIRWQNQRFDGDAAIYERLEAWRKRDRHLYEYEANLRDRLLAHRLDLYRRFAADLRRRYRTVYLEELDLRRLAADDPTSEPAMPGAQHWRHWAAVSQLRQAIRDAGLEVVPVEPAYSTRTCSWCGHLDRDWDPASSVEHTCPECGRTWDQDVNAARNLLSWGVGAVRAVR